MTVCSSDAKPSVSPGGDGGPGSPHPTSPADDDSATRRKGRRFADIVDQDTGPMLVTGIAVITGLLAILGLLFDLFPPLRPVEPPVVRRVEIASAAIVERRRTLPDDIVVDVVFFQVEAIGYDADKIRVSTLWIDARTQQRVGDMQHHANWTTHTRTDRVVGWLEITYPARLPEGSSGCLFVRVLLYPAPDDDATPDSDRLSFILAYADTPPVDVFNSTGSACDDLDPAATEEGETGQDVLSEIAGMQAAGR